MTFWFQFFKHPNTHEGTPKPRNINKSQPHAQLVMTKIFFSMQANQPSLASEWANSKAKPKTCQSGTHNSLQPPQHNLIPPGASQCPRPLPAAHRARNKAAQGRPWKSQIPRWMFHCEDIFFTGQVLLLLIYCKVYTSVHDMYIVNSTLDSL